MKKYLFAGALIVLSFVAGWLSNKYHRPSVPIPMGTARLEVPRNCRVRAWMNGVETDCKDGATIYYVSKLKNPSP